MVQRIARVEAVECASEHEAAWLERNLLERSMPPWNRTAGGQEAEVYIRLDESARAPGVTVVHVPQAAAGVRHFGPYLGGAKVRLAVSGIRRVLPIDYAGLEPASAARELASYRGAQPADLAELGGAIAAVLDREPVAVSALTAELVRRRDAAARIQSYERAGRLQAELTAVHWVVSPQRATVAAAPDADVCGWADGVLTRFEVRGGRLSGWRLFRRTLAQARPWLAATPPQWRDFAEHNALLAAALAGTQPPALRCAVSRFGSTEAGHFGQPVQ